VHRRPLLVRDQETSRAAPSRPQAASALPSGTPLGRQSQASVRSSLSTTSGVTLV